MAKNLSEVFCRNPNSNGVAAEGDSSERGASVDAMSEESRFSVAAASGFGPRKRLWIGSKTIRRLMLIIALLALPTLAQLVVVPAAEVSAAPCAERTFAGLDPWYKYLQCDGDGEIQIDFPGDIWLIAAGVLDILFKIAMYLAVFMVMWGGWLVLISNGNPEGINKGRQVIINALVGMTIAIVSSQLVHFVAGNF